MTEEMKKREKDIEEELRKNNAFGTREEELEKMRNAFKEATEQKSSKESPKEEIETAQQLIRDEEKEDIEEVHLEMDDFLYFKQEVGRKRSGIQTELPTEELNDTLAISFICQEIKNEVFCNFVLFGKSEQLFIGRKYKVYNNTLVAPSKTFGNMKPGNRVVVWDQLLKQHDDVAENFTRQFKMGQALFKNNEKSISFIYELQDSQDVPVCWARNPNQFKDTLLFAVGTKNNYIEIFMYNVLTKKSSFLYRSIITEKQTVAPSYPFYMRWSGDGKYLCLNWYKTQWAKDYLLPPKADTQMQRFPRDFIYLKVLKANKFIMGKKDEQIFISNKEQNKGKKQPNNGESPQGKQINNNSSSWTKWLKPAAIVGALSAGIYGVYKYLTVPKKTAAQNEEE